MPDGGTRRHCRRLPGPATLDAAARTVTAVLATSEPVARETYYEILEMTASAADLSRQPFPLLVDHNNRTEDVIGVVDDVRIAAGELIGRLHFDETPRAEEVWQRVGRGMLGHVSVSYIRHRDKADGSLDGVPRRRATRWELVEISIVGAPADGNARIRAIGGTSMTDSQAVTAGDASDPLPVADNPDIDDSAVASRAVRAERRRIGEIQKLARATGFADQAVVTEIIESGASVETARKRLWDGLAARSANIGCFGSSQWGDAAVNHEDQAIIRGPGRPDERPPGRRQSVVIAIVARYCPASPGAGRHQHPDA